MAFDVAIITRYLKKYPLAIGCATLSVALLAGLYVRNTRAGELARILQVNEQEGQRILGNVRDGANLPEQYDALTAAIRDLDSRLIRGSERASNQQYFYRIESETGVKEINLQPGSAAPAPRRGPKPLYAGVGFTVSVQGNYNQVLDFLGRLESGPHFYRLVRASLARANEGGPAGRQGGITLTVSLELLGMP